MVNLKVLFCLALVALSGVSSLPTHDEVIQLLRPRSNEIRTWVLNRVIGRSSGLKNDNLVCDLCQLLITLGFSFLDQGTPEEVEQGIIDICIELDILAPDLCEGTVRGFFPHIIHIVTERPLTVDDVCGVLINDEGCGVMNETMTNWEVIVDENKPDPVSRPPLPEGIPTTKILHVTDIHPDMDYAEGSLTDCGKPMCCRRGEDWEEPWNSSVQAGPFGDYSCDIPVGAMQNAFLDAANRYEDYKFVVLGGDYVHHGLWFTTKEDIIRHYGAVADSMLGAFPTTQIYPVVGNHESHPSNVFPPTSVWEANPQFDISWVYNTLADLFASQFTPEALGTFRKAGYYTMSPEPGLRVITLNTNFCYTLNFWIMYEPADPEGQLQWFSNQMHLAEQAGEKVFILGHHPPGMDDCWWIWNKHFNAVVDRYQNIIVGQFYGHTHNDDFKVFFDGERPSATAFISPSITPYTDINSGYKVFHFDGARDASEATWELVDSETFTYNLTEANANGQADWYQLYSTKDAYGLSSLRPAELYDFVLRMAANDSLFQLFYAHYNQNSDTFEPCVEAECVRKLLCSLLTSNFNDKSHCAVLDEPIRSRFLL